MPSGEPVLRDLLSWCGFPHARLIFEIPRYGNVRRIQLIAAREAGTFDRFDESGFRPHIVPSAKPSLLARVRRRLRF